MEISAREPEPRPDALPTDEQREATVDSLQRAVGDGRLTLGEFTDRVDLVLAAQTHEQLRAAVRDLPADLPVWSAARSRPRRSASSEMSG